MAEETTNLLENEIESQESDSMAMPDSNSNLQINSPFQENISYGKSRRITQYIAALSVTLGAFAAGTVLGWSSPAGPQLTDGKLNFNVTGEQLSWIGALVCVGAACVCFPIGLLIDTIGRKWGTLVLIIPFTIGWCLIFWADSVVMLYWGRFFTGLAGGAFCVTAPLYTAEIAQKEIRGTLGSYFQLLLTVGILFVYAVGAFVSLSTLSLICLCIPFLYVLAFVFQPETPFYYIKKDRIDDARKSLQYFRGNNYNVELELQEMIAANNETNNSNYSMFEVIRTRAAVKAVYISMGLMFFQQLSGVNAVIFYSGTIFEDANVGIPTSQAIIIVGAMQVIATFISSLVIDKLGRRILLITSDFIMAVCSIGLGVYFGLSKDQQQTVNWLPVTAMSIFIVVFSLGYGPIPWMMIGEVIPKEIRGSLTSFACTFNWVLAFIVTKFYETLSTKVGASTTFYLFAVISFIGTAFVFIIVPETKGKSLEEIQRELSNAPPRTIHPHGGPQVNQAYSRS